MLFPSLSSVPVLLLALCLLVAHSPSSALSIPPSLKSPARVKSVRDPDQWTNAQRLAAGLPPRAPRTFKRATSTVADPFVPGAVRRSAPSPSPSPFAYTKTRPLVETSYSGRIVARYDGTDIPVGFVKASSSGVRLGSDDESARVTFTTTGANALFSISHLDSSTTTDPESFAAAQTKPFIGGAGSSALGAGSSNAVTLGRVQQTSAHARPSAAGAESTIWTFDEATRALTAHWVNPDGSHPRTHVAYRASDGSLILTGDVQAYSVAHPDEPVWEVALYFEGGGN